MRWSSRPRSWSNMATRLIWSITRPCETGRSFMARKRYPPTDPREWLNRARSNLAMAQSDNTGVVLEDLCYEAQQAAEKAVKAVFIHRRGDRGADPHPLGHRAARRPARGAAGGT